MEEIRQHYWSLYLNTISKFICDLTGLKDYKVKAKLLSFNTYLIGLYKYNYIFMPSTVVIKKYQSELYNDIKHNYNITELEFESIINEMIKLRSKFTKVAKSDETEYKYKIKLPDYKHLKKLYTGDLTIR